jgi:hypothetical protein
MDVKEMFRRYRLNRAAEAMMRGWRYPSPEWENHVSVVTFSKEYAEQALEHMEKVKTSGESRKFVKHFLSCLTKFLPSEESYKEALKKRKTEGTTSKQENRKAKLKDKEKNREREEEAPRKKRRKVRR